VKKYSLYGSLCTTNDVLISEFENAEIKDRDYIVFERVGAYSVYEGMSLFLSHELPAVAFYSEKDGLKLVRAQQESFRLNTPLH
jgi:diaminopimelate decarboxylase